MQLQLRMFKKSGVEKRLRKISRQEAESVRLLEKQVKSLPDCSFLSDNVEIFRNNN